MKVMSSSSVLCQGVEKKGANQFIFRDKNDLVLKDQKWREQRTSSSHIRRHDIYNSRPTLNQQHPGRNRSIIQHPRHFLTTGWRQNSRVTTATAVNQHRHRSTADYRSRQSGRSGGVTRRDDSTRPDSAYSVLIGMLDSFDSAASVNRPGRA